MEGQFFGAGGAMVPQQQQQQQFPSNPPPPAPPPGQPLQQQQFGTIHYQYGYVPQPYPYMAPLPPPPPPPPPPSSVAAASPVVLPLTHAFFNPWEPPPPPVPQPADLELQKRIDKLAEYAAKNGPEFEALMKDKQKDNLAYSFLFGGEGHSYYRYKLWVTINAHLAFNPALSIVSPALALGLPAVNPTLGPSAATASFPAFYDQQQPVPPPQPPPQQLFEQQRDGGLNSQSLKWRGIPSDVAAGLRSLLDTLTGTKESIKGARVWFMQRSSFAPALAEALEDRVTGSDDVERQMHVLYLINDIIFNSLQFRPNVKELDNEALAFRPVLGSILAAIYQNPHINEADQGQMEKMLQFWGAKEVYDSDTIRSLEREMRTGHPSGAEAISVPQALTGATTTGSVGQWKQEQPGLSPEQKQEQPLSSFAGVGASVFPAAVQFNPSSAANSNLAATAFLAPPAVPTVQQPPALATIRPEQAQAPYPLFPPGLIPGMVRKMQIGSGVPYSSLSPLDIPTVIPPSTASESHILDHVSKFFKDVGEPDPLRGKFKSDEEPEEERGGARIPPPSEIQVDSDTGTLPDGTVDYRPGMSSTGRLGLGAAADPNEVTQYDDVYTSYRKQRSTNYHTSLSARAAAR